MPLLLACLITSFWAIVLVVEDIPELVDDRDTLLAATRPAADRATPGAVAARRRERRRAFRRCRGRVSVHGLGGRWRRARRRVLRLRWRCDRARRPDRWILGFGGFRLRPRLGRRFWDWRWCRCWFRLGGRLNRRRGRSRLGFGLWCRRGYLNGYNWFGCRRRCRSVHLTRFLQLILNKQLMFYTIPVLYCTHSGFRGFLHDRFNRSRNDGRGFLLQYGKLSSAQLLIWTRRCDSHLFHFRRSDRLFLGRL